MAGEGTPSQAAAVGPAGAQLPTDAARVAPSADVGAPVARTAGLAGAPRASDVDRNAMVARLSKATGEGRITLEEFADAAGAAYAAITLAELDALYRSFGLDGTLPPPPDAALPPPPVAVAPAGATGAAALQPGAATTVGAPRADPSVMADNVVAIMSGADRKGRWQVRRRTRAFAFMGAVNLDLRDAVIESDVVEIEAWAVMGGVTITVPEGIPVELSGCVIMGGRTSRVRDVPILPGAPTIRVRARGMWGGVDVRSKRSRRTVDPEAAASPSERTWARHGGPAMVHDHDHDHDHRHGDRDRARDRDRDRDRDRARRRERGGSGPDRPVPSGDLLTIVCTDIVGSTRLAVSLGDQRWHGILSAHNAVVRRLLRRFGGTEVKTSGDGFLLTFTSARAALQFSMELQEEIEADRSTRPEAPIELRIGVHAGEVERDGADVIGRNVTIACRLCDAAAPGEVLASSMVADLADSASDLAFGDARQHRLAGIDQPLGARPATRA